MMKLYIIICLTTITFTSCTREGNSKQKPKDINTNFNEASTPNEDAKLSNGGLSKIYSQAIADYLTEVSKHHLITCDTLFFGKRNYGQSDDFPDIVLPGVIKNCQIRLIKPEIGKKLQEEKKSRVYINLVGWVDKDKAEFIFVTFSNGFEHQFDLHIDYKYNFERKEFELTEPQIKKFNMP